MHSFEGLAAELAALLKKRGDSGDSGDRACNKLNLQGFGVTARPNKVSPVDLRPVTDPESRGDNKIKQVQWLNEGVTAVTAVTANFEQGVESTAPIAYPAKWYAILQELKRSEPPSWTSANRWRELADDAEAFLESWGETAVQLGWVTLSLFGVHPETPARRFDVMGLIPVLQGGRVVVLTEQDATIRRVSGARLTFRRPSSAATTVPITEAGR
jgi:hypothetical protein